MYNAFYFIKENINLSKRLKILILQFMEKDENQRVNGLKHRMDVIYRRRNKKLSRTWKAKKTS